MRNIIYLIFSENLVLSFSGQSSELEDYYFEGSNEGSSDVIAGPFSYDEDYQGRGSDLNSEKLRKSLLFNPGLQIVHRCIKPFDPYFKTSFQQRI